MSAVVLGKNLIEWRNYLNDNLAERRAITKVWNDYILSNDFSKKVQGQNLRAQIDRKIKALKVNALSPSVYKNMPLAQLQQLINQVQQEVNAINVGTVMNFGADALRKAPKWLVLNDLKQTLGQRAINQIMAQTQTENPNQNPDSPYGGQNPPPGNGQNPPATQAGFSIPKWLQWGALIGGGIYAAKKFSGKKGMNKPLPVRL